MESRKLVAILLALFGPWGIGHFHLGRRARGCAWLAVPVIGLFVLGALVPVVGRRLGWSVAVALPFLAVVALWALSFIDVLRSPDVGKVPIWQTLVFFVVGLLGPVLASAFIRLFVLEAFVVPTQSMHPTVLAGDHLFASKSERQVHYGDVIVFTSPEHPDQMLVKRIIAMPWDILEVKRGRPIVNGWEVPQCPLGTVMLGGTSGELDVEFLGDASYLVFYDASAAVAEHAGPLYAAHDGVLVLGDDRNDSADSRTWHGGRDGNVAESSVRGHALFVWLRTSQIDDARFGIGLDHIRLPSTLAHLEPDLDRCLSARPNAMPPRSIRR